MSSPAAALVAILTTHTTRHLHRTLLGVASQTRKADRVVVSCDTDARDIRDLVEAAAADLGLDITLVQRPFTGKSRSGQVRNNAIRAIAADLPPAPRLVFLDGDCVPTPDAFDQHVRLAGSLPARRPGRLVVGFRIDLSAEQTEAFSDDSLRSGRMPVAPTPSQLMVLHTRERRYRRQAFLRRLGLSKGHKPKVLSANFSIALGDYAAINGFDEAYEGYGQEDDDFGRRFYRIGGRPVIAVSGAIVLHLYHPTRAPGDWHESPNAARFQAGGPSRCIVGLDNPAPQPPPAVLRFAGSPATIPG